MVQLRMDIGSESFKAGDEREEARDRWKLFRPFPRQTTTLVAGPSFLGKSTYVRRLVEHQHLFFQDPVIRLFVINCNDAVTFSSLEEPNDQSPQRRPLAELVQRTWDNFDVGELEPGDVLVIDDLQRVTEKLREIVNAAIHHLGLGHCFVITHGVLGSRQYELLNLVHRIALFCSSTSIANLAGYILSTRILDPDLKSRLKEALGAAQRSREVLILELSSLPEGIQPFHAASSHLLKLTDPRSGYAIVYPHPSRVEMYQEDAENVEDAEMKHPEDASRNLPNAGDFVSGSFLVLRPELVASLKKKKKKKEKSEKGQDSGTDSEGKGKCADREELIWNQTVLRMENEVETFLPRKQWRQCKSLLYEILHNPEICLLQDGRRIKLHNRPGIVASIIDYLSTATRRDAPSERLAKGKTQEFKTFRQITDALLRGYAPKTLFKNRMVLPGKSESGRHSHGRGFSRSRNETERVRRRRRKELSPEVLDEVEFGDLDFSAMG